MAEQSRAGVFARAVRRMPVVRGVQELREQNERLQRRVETLRGRLARAKATREEQLDVERATARSRRRELLAQLGAARAQRAEERQRAGGLQRAVAWQDAEDQTTRRGTSGVRARVTSASLLEALSRGEDPTAALIDYGRALLALPLYPYRFRLPALAMALQEVRELQTGFTAAQAVLAHGSGQRELARHHLAALGSQAAGLLPVEYAEVVLQDDAQAGPGLLDELATVGLSSSQWLDVMAALAAVGDTATLFHATELTRPLLARWTPEELTGWERHREIATRVEPTDLPAIRFGVMGYRRPDTRIGSKNVGDFVQTIGALGHLLRHEGLRFSGDPELVGAVEELRARVRPDLRIDALSGGRVEEVEVGLVEVGRDDSHLDQVPVPTWYLAFGWHIHPDRLGRHHLPYHPNLRPFFVAFHVNRREMLTDDAVDYLRRYAPIGCRDWFTVDMLTRLGIPAFFSGCLTTTVDTYFDRIGNDPEKPEGFVDARPRKGADLLRQADPQVRVEPIGVNLRRALGVLDTYQAEYGALTTSRLHCYLPATTIGVPTTFVPKRTYDVRFEGLFGPDADIPAMRSRIRTTLLEPMFRAILAGASEEEVYRTWREITQPMVAVDTAMRASAYDWPEGRLDLAAAAERIRGRARARRVREQRPADTVDLCFGLDENYVEHLQTVLHCVLQKTDRPVTVWAMVRGWTTAHFERIERAFPEVDITFLPCDDVDYGSVSAGASRITVSTMDRLLLPAVLADLDRVVYLDLDLLPMDDVGALYDTDLQGAPLAARRISAADAMGSLSSFADLATSHFPDSVEGWRLLNLAQLRTHAGDHAFNAGVLVLDLARLRADDFTERYAPFVEAFGLNDQHVLNLYAGDRFRPLDPRWNHWPERDAPLDEPGIVHWIGPLKPWGDLLVGYRDAWRDAVTAAGGRIADA